MAAKSTQKIQNSTNFSIWLYLYIYDIQDRKTDFLDSKMF